MKSDDVRPTITGEHGQSVTLSAIQPPRKRHKTTKTTKTKTKTKTTKKTTTRDSTSLYWGVPPQSVGWSLRYVAANLRTSLPLAVSDQIGLACALSLVASILPGSDTLSGMVLDVHFHLASGLAIVFSAARLYPGVGLAPRVEFRHCSMYASCLFLLFVLAVLTFGVAQPAAQLLVATWALTLVFIPLGRLATRRIFGRFRWWRQPVLTIADSRSHVVRALTQRLLDNPQLGLSPIDTPVNVVRETFRNQGDDNVTFRFDAKKSIARVTREHRVYRAIIATPDESDTRSVRRFVSSAEWFPCLLVVSPISKQGSPLDGRPSWTLGEFTGVQLHNRLRSPIAYLAKRAFDVSIAAVGLLVSVPIILIIGAAVRFSSPGPVFYGQRRMGRGGRRFRLWKFRTMVGDADEVLEDFLDSRPELKRQWDREKKLSHDPRVIPYVGQFLRKSSLDELPQLWNVLRGDMSLVGPRPLPEYHLNQFDVPFRHYRQNVSPGITGLWQVSSRGDGYPETYINWDSHYIRNWSLWLDAKVLARTVTAVVSGRGAA